MGKALRDGSLTLFPLKKYLTIQINSTRGTYNLLVCLIVSKWQIADDKRSNMSTFIKEIEIMKKLFCLNFKRVK